MTLPHPLVKLARTIGTDWKEMYKVFNIGHCMELYVPQDCRKHYRNSNKPQYRCVDHWSRRKR